MVKLQKPIPKNLGNKPKLNNPIKEKKQQLKKEKSSITQKAKLLEDSTPVKEAKVASKPGKEVIAKKQQKKELNGEKKNAAKKLLIPVPESPEKSQNGKGKKIKPGKEKNVATNGVKQAAEESTKAPEKTKKKNASESTKAPEKSKKKTASVEEAKAPVSEKPDKKSKKVKAPPAEEVAAPVKLAPPTKAKAEAVAAPPKAEKALKKNVNATPAPPQAAAQQKKAGKTISAAPDKKSKKAAPAPQNDAAVDKQGKPGKKQKNKNKKNASAPETEAPPALEKIKKPKKPVIALQEKKKAKIAFKKAKKSSKTNELQSDKKEKAGTTFRYDPIPYDEDQFHAIVNVENIKKIAKALKTTVEKEVQTKKSTIFDDYRYFLEVASFKIPSCPKRMVKLNLKHSLVGKDDDVLLIVPDLKRGGKVDYEATKHHYEDLLRQNGVEGITVMPMNQLRREYRTYEQKRRLCASYEHFMCEGRIVGHIGALIGNFTQKPRNTFHSVRLNENKDIKAEIGKSLRKTAYRQLAKSSLQSIPVGTHKFTTDQLAENIDHVVSQLKTVLPGGLGNVRSLHLKISLTGTSSLPLYISMAQAPEETPMVIGPREERLVKLKREANEVLANFAMTKEGKLVKLSKPAAEKKRKLIEMKAALKADENEEEPTKKAKKATKENVKNEKKSKKAKEPKDLELPENEEEEDDDTGDEDEDDEDVIQLGQGSDDETDDDMANVEDEDAESGAEIVENGFVGEDDEESEEDDEQEVNQNENDEDDDEEDEDDDDEEDDDEEESD